MATKPTFTMPLILIRNDGWTEIFYDFESLAAVIFSSKIVVSDAHADRQWVRFYYEGELRGRFQDVYNEWIVRDDRGRTVASQDISEYAPWKKNHQSYLDKKRTEAQHCRELGLPIPHTSCRRSWGAWYRVPRHIAAWRDKYAFDIDYRGGKIKTNSKEKLPPTAWDDCIRASTYDRSWKKYRKHQWKE